jgi:hypothetical protein
MVLSPLPRRPISGTTTDGVIMRRHSALVGALGAMCVGLFVAGDAEAAPVDNWGNFVWLLGGRANVMDGLNVAAHVDLSDGAMESFIDSAGNMSTLRGFWGGQVPLTDKYGAPIMVPASSPEPLAMAINVLNASSGTLDATPGQESIRLDLTVALTFHGQTFSCTTPTFDAKFTGQYSYDPSTGVGAFQVSGTMLKLPRVSGCNGYDTFINNTLRLGSSYLLVFFATGEARETGPHGS